MRSQKSAVAERSKRRASDSLLSPGAMQRSLKLGYETARSRPVKDDTTFSPDQGLTEARRGHNKELAARLEKITVFQGNNSAPEVRHVGVQHVVFVPKGEDYKRAAEPASLPSREEFAKKVKAAEEEREREAEAIATQKAVELEQELAAKAKVKATEKAKAEAAAKLAAEATAMEVLARKERAKKEFHKRLYPGDSPIPSDHGIFRPHFLSPTPPHYRRRSLDDGLPMIEDYFDQKGLKLKK